MVTPWFAPPTWRIEDGRQTLDVYRAASTRKGAPVVVFLYGGRWKYSTKHDYLLVGNALARQGWIAVLPNYRLFPSARFPAWVVDGASAVRWVRGHAAEYGGDSTNIVVVGHSSSAHTVVCWRWTVATWLRLACP